MKIGNANRNNSVNQTGPFSFLMFITDLMFITEKMKICMSCFVIEYQKWIWELIIYIFWTVFVSLRIYFVVMVPNSTFGSNPGV